eukprot:gene43763-54380_t
MLNFDFHNPTRIAFGQGRIADLDKLVPAAAKVLILVGGASAEKTGILAEVRTALGGRQHATFTGIEPNPSYETSMNAVAQIREGGFDFLLAVGGGSVIDATKFIAAAVLFEGGDPWAILEKFGRNVQRALPFGAVLTLPATGSEMNNGSVITHRAKGAKLPFSSEHTYPVFSVLDPTKTYTLPPQQLANGVVDAFVHTVEQYLTYPVNAPVQDRFAEGILHTLIEVGPRLLTAPEPVYDDRAPNYHQRACSGLLAISPSGTGTPHCASSSLQSPDALLLVPMAQLYQIAVVKANNRNSTLVSRIKHHCDMHGLSPSTQHILDAAYE